MASEIFMLLNTVSSLVERWFIKSCLFVVITVFISLNSVVTHADLKCARSSDVINVQYHRVSTGQTLSTIARQYLGNAFSYTELIDRHNNHLDLLKQQLEKDGIFVDRDSLKIRNPNSIEVGSYVLINIGESRTNLKTFHGHISVKGSSTVHPFMKKAQQCFLKYRKFSSSGKIDLFEPIGSQAGLDLLNNSESNYALIVPVSHFKKYKKMRDDGTLKVEMIYFSVARDVLAFLVKPELFESPPSINYQGLADLLAKKNSLLNDPEKLDTWGDIIGIKGLKEQAKRVPIYRFYPTADSGTLPFVVDALSKQVGNYRTDLRESDLLDSTSVFGVDIHEDNFAWGQCRNNQKERDLKKQSKNKQNTTEDDLCIAKAILEKAPRVNGYLNPTPIEPNFGFLSYSYLNGLEVDPRGLLKVDGSGIEDDRYHFSRYLYLFTTKKIMIDYKDSMCDFIGYMMDNSKDLSMSVGYKPVSSGRERTNRQKYQQYCSS